MRVALEGVTGDGAADLRGRVPAQRAIAAIEDPEDGLVECPRPGELFAYAGHVTPGMSLPVRAAVAAAARSRGASSPHDEALAAVEAELAEMPEPSVDLADRRRRVAETRRAEEGLRERVARLAGRVEALRERDDPESAEEELAAATRELADAETERIAAEQSLARARREAAAVRDARERRLELADRRANLRQAARDALVAEHYDAFARAVRAVPGEGQPGDHPASYRGSTVTAALAVLRIGAPDAPVVLDCERFPSPSAAAACLDAAVLRV